jgi:DtxR family transcriptional regulator, Mn-dependent transcriptional regulator
MTASLIRCLLAVLALNENYERVASKDVAHLLGVRKPTIHNTLLTLQERGLIDKERYGDVHLTDEGLDTAHRLERQRDDLALLFSRELGLEPEESVRAAILMISELSEESLARMCARTAGSGATRCLAQE